MRVLWDLKLFLKSLESDIDQSLEAVLRSCFMNLFEFRMAEYAVHGTYSEERPKTS